MGIVSVPGDPRPVAAPRWPGGADRDRRRARMWASAQSPPCLYAAIMKWSSARKDSSSASVVSIPRPSTRPKAGSSAPPRSPSALPRCRPASTATRHAYCRRGGGKRALRVPAEAFRGTEPPNGRGHGCDRARRLGARRRGTRSAPLSLTTWMSSDCWSNQQTSYFRDLSADQTSSRCSS